MRQLIEAAQIAYEPEIISHVSQDMVVRSKPEIIDWFVSSYTDMIQSLGIPELNETFMTEKIRVLWCFEIDDGNGKPFYILVSDYGAYPRDITKNRVWYAWHQGAPLSGLEYWWKEIERRIK